MYLVESPIGLCVLRTILFFIVLIFIHNRSSENAVKSIRIVTGKAGHCSKLERGGGAIELALGAVAPRRHDVNHGRTEKRTGGSERRRERQRTTLKT